MWNVVAPTFIVLQCCTREYNGKSSSPVPKGTEPKKSGWPHVALLLISWGENSQAAWATCGFMFLCGVFYLSTLNIRWSQCSRGIGAFNMCVCGKDDWTVWEKTKRRDTHGRCDTIDRPLHYNGEILYHQWNAFIYVFIVARPLNYVMTEIIWSPLLYCDLLGFLYFSALTTVGCTHLFAIFFMSDISVCIIFRLSINIYFHTLNTNEVQKFKAEVVSGIK